MTKKVYIAGFSTKEKYGIGPTTFSMFARNKWENARHIEEADLVVFTGGEDVSPELYGQKNVKSYPSLNRDKYEIEVYNDAKLRLKPIFGICRGMQFMNVMEGGLLWQDVSNHPGPKNRRHTITLEIGKHDHVFETNSLHHQMVIPAKEFLTIGYCQTDETIIKRSDQGAFGYEELEETIDPEVIWNPSNNLLGVQFHPEFMGNEEEPVYRTFQLINNVVY